MNEKIFVTFLGTGKYNEVNYCYEGKSFKSKFAPLAILGILKQKQEIEEVKTYVIVTDESEETRWPEFENEYKSSFNREPEKIKTKLISSENEIWELYKKIEEKIPENYEVYCDITHSFRSLPAIFNYILLLLQITKKLKVKGIFYGAYDARDNNMNTPILNLLPVISVADWAKGLSMYFQTGDTSLITELSKGSYVPRLAQTRGKDEIAKSLRAVTEFLSKFEKQIKNCRCIDIIRENDYEAFNNNLNILTSTGSLDSNLYPILSLLNKLKLKFSKYKNNNVLNGFYVVEFCIEYGYYQQGYTILEEMIITYLLDRFNNNDFLEEKKRNAISSLLACMSDNKPEDEWKGDLKELKDFAKEIKNKIDSSYTELPKVFKNLQNLRNDLNHAGFRKTPASPETIHKNLKSNFEEIMNLFQIQP